MGYNQNRYEYNGRFYTVDELKAIFSSRISTNLIKKRILRKWDLEDCFNVPYRGFRTKPLLDNPIKTDRRMSQSEIDNLRSSSGEDKYEYKGRNYSIKELFDFFSPRVDFAVFESRMLKGWSPEDAINKDYRVPRNRDAKKWEFRGRMLTVHELKKVTHSKLTISQISKRLNRGWNIVDACLTPIGVRQHLKSNKPMGRISTDTWYSKHDKKRRSND